MSNETAISTEVITPTQVIPREAQFSLVPRSYAELEQVALRLSESALIPTSLKSKPGDIIVAMETLRTLGVNPIAGLQGVVVINGRVSLFGEWWLGLVQSSPVYAGQKEEWDEATKTATVYFWRKGVAEPFVGTFSEADATKGGLMGRDTYKTFPKDMITWRARHRAGAAAFSDVLHGILPSQVAADYPPPDQPVPVPAPPAMPHRKSDTVRIEPAITVPVGAVGDAISAPVEPPPAPAPPAPEQPVLVPPASSAPETHTVRKAVSVSLPKAKGGGTVYEITLGDERVFKSKDAAIYRAAAAAEEGKYPVKVVTVGDTITLLLPSK